MSGNPGVGAMGQSEVLDFIKDSRVGVLTLVDGDRPYGVPVEHYFDGKNLYFLTSARDVQRKWDCIERNPRACFVIYESRREKPELVSKGIPCRSVVIEGRISRAEIRETESKERGKVQVRALRMDVDRIGNWRCQRKLCDWRTPWFVKHPDLTDIK